MGASTAACVELRASADGRSAALVLDAGKGNVIGSRLIEELRAAVAQLARQRSLCALRLEHTGEHFSYGASVPEHAPGEVERMLPAFHALARELLALDTPILACVRGLCLGGGLELALCADLVFAAPNASFGQPEIQLGVFAPLGSILLPRFVGAARASELLLSGRRMDAAEALRSGLVHEIAPDPGAVAQAYVQQQLAPRSAEALRHATRAARSGWLPALHARLGALEHAYLNELMATHDAREGIAAFLGKRPARWEDR